MLDETKPKVPEVPEAPKLPTKVRPNLMERIQKASQEATFAKQQIAQWSKTASEKDGEVKAYNNLIAEEYQVGPLDEIAEDGTISRKS